MATNDSCCGPSAKSPVVVDYTPVGRRETVDGMEVYVTGSGSKALLVVYDIFGFDFKQVFQVCDRLADHGFTVAAPDLLRGKPWPMARMPPKPEDNFMGWIQTTASYPELSPSITATLQYLRGTLGVTSVGTLGFCWGALIAFSAASDPSQGVKATGCVHPSFFGKPKEVAEALPVPAILLPAKGDDMEKLKEVLDTKPFGVQCFYQRFDHMSHGFCAARGDFADPVIAAAATEAIGLLGTFYAKTL